MVIFKPWHWQNSENDAGKMTHINPRYRKALADTSTQNINDCLLTLPNFSSHFPAGGYGHEHR